MEQCLRIALWMFFLIGYLQAKPVSSEQCPSGGSHRFIMHDLCLGYLRQNVACGDNVNFTTPDVQSKCHNADLTRFMDGLEHAMKNCRDDQSHINNTLEALDNDPEKTTQADSSGPKLNTTETKFEKFVDELEKCVQILNIKSSIGN